MKLSNADKKEVISYLPDFELSYEKLIHNKVHNYTICFAIPYGRKYLAWFTTFKHEFVCIFLEIDNRTKKINDVKIIPCCFDCSINASPVLFLIIGVFVNVGHTA